MLIELASPQTLRITRMDGAYDWLAALPGSQYDKEHRALLVRLSNLRTIAVRFPTARYVDQAAIIEARRAQWERWIVQHNNVGVRFYDDGQTVQAVGEGVSPVFQDWVAEHSDVLRNYLHVQVQVACLVVEVAEPPTIEVTEGERLILAGMRNAAKAEERNQERSKRQYRKRKTRHVAMAGK